MGSAEPRKLVDLASGLVSREIYSAEPIYRQEIERVFARSWLFLGHESAIPRNGDYVATYMGEDPVILCRDGHGRIRAFLNTCRHRGNRVCLFERGNTSTFTCSYHGWSYSTEGKLVGVPFHADAYYGHLDRDRWGLAEVPYVSGYGGLIFGAWSPVDTSLEAYLGEMRWYLDNVLLLDDLGGLEVIATSRYVGMGNWKVPAENFAGDHYHTFTTHGSSYKLGLGGEKSTFEGEQAADGPFEVALKPGHGLGGLVTGDEAYRVDQQLAQKMGPEVVDYVEERYRCLGRRQQGAGARAYCFTHANVFPNFALGGGRTALRGNALYLFQPKGPLKTEVMQWVILPRQAPAAVREVALKQFGQGGHFASGFFEQDDAENFERVTEGTRTFLARQFPFFYGMSQEYEGHWPGQEGWDIQGLPGVIGPRFSEHCQRNFYRFWDETMGGVSAAQSSC